VKNEEVLHTVKDKTNILLTINRIKTNYTGHMLNTNCLLKHIIDGKTERRVEMMGWKKTQAATR
jgi:hypothetical protein